MKSGKRRRDGDNSIDDIEQLHRRRHNRLLWHIPDRIAAVRHGLVVLLELRAIGNQGDRVAAAIGGRLDLETIDYLLLKIRGDYMRTVTGEHGWNEETRARVRRMDTLIWRLRPAFACGLGQVPAGSVESEWLVEVRPWLAWHEIGWILRAADTASLRVAVDDRDANLDAAIDKAIESWRPTKHDQVNALAKFGRKRWERLQRAGFQDELHNLSM